MSDEFSYPQSIDFATVNDWAHESGRLFEELLFACLGMATEIDQLRAERTLDERRIADLMAELNGAGHDIERAEARLALWVESVNALRAELDALKNQKPVLLWHLPEDPDEEEVFEVNEHNLGCPCCKPLYASPTPPSGPSGWLRAIDEELVCTHLGVANELDSYDEAKDKLSQIIAWHVAVATDPAVNGGYTLVPIEPTEGMREAMTDFFLAINGDCRKAFAQAYADMLAAAPKPEVK